MLLKYLKVNDRVLFIPYTTDMPQLKIGRIEKDYYNKLFIAYGDVYCDNGEYFICKLDEIKDNLNTINKKLDYAIQEFLKGQINEI